MRKLIISDLLQHYLESHTNLIQILEERRKWTFRTKLNSLFTVDLTFHLPLCLQTDAEPLGCCAAGCVGAHRRRPTPGAAGVRKKIFNDLQLHLLDSSFSLFCLRDTTVTVWFMRRGLTFKFKENHQRAARTPVAHFAHCSLWWWSEAFLYLPSHTHASQLTCLSGSTYLHATQELIYQPVLHHHHIDGLGSGFAMSSLYAFVCQTVIKWCVRQGRKGPRCKTLRQN